MGKDPNPMAQSFNDMVTEWERNFDAFANQVMGTDAYSRAMNEMQKAQLQYQKGMSEAMAQHLCNLNMPSREDVLQLSEAIRQLDRRLERIEDKLFLNDQPPASNNKPARTRTPPRKSQVRVAKAGAGGRGVSESSARASNSAAEEKPDSGPQLEEIGATSMEKENG